MRVDKLVTLAVTAAVAVGCSSGKSDPPACHAGMPPASQFLKDPAFASLTYHTNQEIKAWRDVAYDLWANSKFEYTTGLEYALAPMKDSRNWDDLCAFAISLRFSVPAQEIDRQKLHVFATAIAASQQLDPVRVENDLKNVLASGDKFRPRPLQGKVTLEAGQLFHPTRGEFFMATFTWPRPVLTAK